MTAIDPSLLLSTYQNQQKVTTTGNDTLGKDAFLQLLMVQLQNQDPTKPMDDTEFISQMATFSSLEQMTNIATGIEDLKNIQQKNSLSSYQQFVGKDVTWHKMSGEDPNNLQIEEGTGKVASIQFKEDEVHFILADGTELEPGNISQLHAPSAQGNVPAANSLIAASELIGKKVSYLNESNEEISSIVKSVLMKDGKTHFEISDESETKLTAEQLIKIAMA